jgi:hypothetical protein
MAKLPEMNSDFARWYAETFMDEGATRTARWKGVVETAAAADYVMVEVLVRLAFATSAPASGMKNEGLKERYQAVLSTISGNGTAMDASASQRELQVLAAAALVRLFARLPGAAIAVVNASFNGERTVDLPMDLAGLAKQALVALSKRKHERPNSNDLVIAAPKVDFEVSEEAMATMSVEQWKGELDRLRVATAAAMRSIVEGQNRVAKLLSHQIELGEEELQMLWWLIGGQSGIADKPFANVDKVLKPLLFGQKLGEMTKVSPGPASVTAILSRAGVGDNGLKIQDAINAADTDWARRISESTRISPVTTPLHFALEKRVEIGANDAWQAIWASMTGLPADTSLPPVKLAELFYREHLFLHVGG